MTQNELEVLSETLVIENAALTAERAELFQTVSNLKEKLKTVERKLLEREPSGHHYFQWEELERNVDIALQMRRTTMENNERLIIENQALRTQLAIVNKLLAAQHGGPDESK